MKKLFIFLMCVAILATSVFAQNEEESIGENNQLKKHQFLDQYFGLNIGASGMRTSGHGIFTANLGVNYDFYLHEWVSLNTGFLLHTEFYFNHNLLTNHDPMVIPMCFTIPFGVYINIPKVEWLYTGVSVAVNIPIANLQSPKFVTQPEKQNVFGDSSVFISLPIDLGFDFIKHGRGGTRALIRVSPTFHKGGITVPVGFVWQIYNWKVFSKKVDVNVEVPKVEVNIPHSIMFNTY